MDKPNHPENRNDRLIPLCQARELVGISRSKLYELISAGAFPNPAKLGSRCYFSELELQQWIAARLADRPANRVTK